MKIKKFILSFRKQTGQSLVEFALVCVLCGLLITFGTIDLSRMVSLATRIASIAREGGRLYIALDLDPSTITATELRNELRTEVYNEVKEMIAPQGSLDTNGKVIFSILIRRDPNDDTVYTDPNTYDDDYIEIAYQEAFPDNPPPWISRVGELGDHISSDVLDLDMLRVDEQTIAVEIFHENNMITPISHIWNAVGPEYLYDVAFF